MTDTPHNPEERPRPESPPAARDANLPGDGGASARAGADFDAACRLLRARRIGREDLARIAGDARLQASYEVRLGTVLRPELPLGSGLPLLGSLRWRDLARVMDDVRLFAPLRARAEQLLAERTGEMTSGEKITLARLASRFLIRRMRDSYDARVVAALLANPRAIEEDALRIARSDAAPPAVLAVLARSGRWSERHAIKMALAQNPRCPPVDSLRALRGLPARDLERISENPSAPRLVRVGASRLLAESPDALH